MIRFLGSSFSRLFSARDAHTRGRGKRSPDTEMFVERRYDFNASIAKEGIGSRFSMYGCSFVFSFLSSTICAFARLDAARPERRQWA
jgi:hypothetical protein